jgi:Ca2+-dependent lipid-binding protein
MGVLTVKLLKVTNLRDEDGIGKSDPYVKFHLEQDNYVFDKNYGKKESSHKKNELSPEYNETFTFEDVPTMNNMVLHVTVKDDDIGRDATIGACTINLEKLDPGADPVPTEAVVDKKGSKRGLLKSICNPCETLCACCCSLFKRKAVIYLEISYEK